MVIDYRKLNEMTISDEFPLPKQEDILQALEGSQWLSTLDTLAFCGCYVLLNLQLKWYSKHDGKPIRQVFEIRNLPTAEPQEYTIWEDL